MEEDFDCEFGTNWHSVFKPYIKQINNTVELKGEIEKIKMQINLFLAYKKIPQREYNDFCNSIDVLNHLEPAE